jgi:hypothetical protein
LTVGPRPLAYDVSDDDAIVLGSENHREARRTREIHSVHPEVTIHDGVDEVAQLPGALERCSGIYRHGPHQRRHSAPSTYRCLRLVAKSVGEFAGREGRVVRDLTRRHLVDQWSAAALRLLGGDQVLTNELAQAGVALHGSELVG